MNKKNGGDGEWKIPTMPDQKAITKVSAPLVSRVADYSITSEEHFTASWAIIEQIDETIVRVEDMMNPFVKGLKRLHSMACDMRDGFLEPLVDAKNILLGKRKVFREAEEKKKADAAAKLAEGLRKQQQKDLEKQARAAEKQKDPQTAAALREQKEQVPLPYFNPVPAVPKQQGSVLRQTWLFEIVDADAVPRQYCTPDEKKIRKVVQALGNAANIPGVRVWIETNEYSRRITE